MTVFFRAAAPHWLVTSGPQFGSAVASEALTTRGLVAVLSAARATFVAGAIELACSDRALVGHVMPDS